MHADCQVGVTIRYSELEEVSAVETFQDEPVGFKVGRGIVSLQSPIMCLALEIAMCLALEIGIENLVSYPCPALPRGHQRGKNLPLISQPQCILSRRLLTTCDKHPQNDENARKSGPLALWHRTCT